MFNPTFTRRAVKALVLLIGAALAACTGPLEPTNPYDDDGREPPFGEFGVTSGARK